MPAPRPVFRTLAGTAILLVAGGILWSLQAGREGNGPSQTVVTPPAAKAEVIITPGPSRRSPARPRALASSETDGTPAASKLSGASKPGTKAEKSDDDESWQVILLDDQRIGWSRTTSRKVEGGKKPILRTTSEVQMTIKRFGQTVELRKTTITDETESGDLLSYSMEQRNPPAAPTLTTGVMDGNELVIETTVDGKKQKTRMPWDPEVKSPAYEDRLLKNDPLKPGDKRSFRTFVPDFNKVSTVRVVADDYQMVKMLDGGQRRLLKTRTTHSILPDMTTRAWIDESGRTLRTEDDMLGRKMVMYRVSKEEALEKIAGADLDIAVSSMIAAGSIRNPFETQRVVYRITLPGDDPAKYIATGETQSVARVSPETIDLTVITVTLPRELKDVAIGEEFRKATQFLQSNDPAVIEHARRAVPIQTDRLRAAVQMEQYVKRAVSKKSFSTALASAAEVAKSLEGDCTEHAVLLAAMLRNRGIPSRVAVGLVYVEAAEAFGGHMWTEAWLGGHWYPLDATLGRGRPDAVHIKLSDSSLADDAPAPVTSFLPLVQILGRMKLTVVETKGRTP